MIKLVQPIFSISEAKPVIPLSCTADCYFDQHGVVRSWELNQRMDDHPSFFEDGLCDVVGCADMDHLVFALALLRDIPALRLSINIRLSMVVSGYAPSLLSLLASHDRDTLERLTIEITESGMTIGRRLMDHAHQFLLILQGLGILLSIDDYGSGHSAAGRLLWDVWSEAKIDGHIVQAAAASRRIRTLLYRITQALREMGLLVVFEWIETEAMLDMSYELGANAVQGYYTGRPRPASNLAECASSVQDMAETME